MNAVEIEEAVSKLAESPFDPAAFPYAFLEAFGNKAATLKRLKSGVSNQSDLDGVLQRSNIHIKVCPDGEVSATLDALRQSAATARQKAKFILATDGKTIEAENLADDLPPLVCEFKDLPNHFGYFLPLAGITTVRQISENAFDIRATGRLNRLYVELLKHNPDWDTDARRQDLNQFFARLIFCFFAEDTGIFFASRLFTDTLERMTDRNGSNTAWVLSELFRAMNTPHKDRAATDLRAWALKFPYVNGNLFSGSTDVPKFSQIARAYLLFVGGLDWKQINPDIFGSMIQAVADDEERGALGMHYTSVPNILKVLNPLFLDDLRQKLAEAGDSQQKLLNLRKRLARIRVFDPACGSGNFLVIAYKQMREIEAQINRRRGESDKPSVIPPTNFRGIEIRHFAAEIARLALVIAKFQCDAIYRGDLPARSEFLPLEKANWITCGNALRLDWLKICPPTGTGVKVRADDLFSTPLDQAEIDFENTGGEIYVCGNPPYSGKGKKEDQHIDDMNHVLGRRTEKFGYIDYVGCWFVLAADYCRKTNAIAAMVATNSVCQGRQLPQLWPHVPGNDCEITFAHLSFKWSNSATRNAGVICVIVAIAQKGRVNVKTIYDEDTSRSVPNINAYLLSGANLFVESHPRPLSDLLPTMLTGSVPNDGGFLIVDPCELQSIAEAFPHVRRFVYPFFGSQDYLQGLVRFCFVIPDQQVWEAREISPLAERLDRVAELRDCLQIA